jgi:hypothetical protein
MCSHSLLTHLTKKKIKTGTLEAPQNRSFYSKVECLPLWSTYIYFEQSICIKRVELLGTHQKLGEPFENLMRTHCEQFKKPNHPPPPIPHSLPLQKEKTLGVLGACVALPHWLSIISICSFWFVTIFNMANGRDM